MSKPIVTIALSDDGNSVFVYAGGVELATDNGALAYDEDTREIHACIGLQNADHIERVTAVVERIMHAVLV